MFSLAFRTRRYGIEYEYHFIEQVTNSGFLVTVSLFSATVWAEAFYPRRLHLFSSKRSIDAPNQSSIIQS